MVLGNCSPLFKASFHPPFLLHSTPPSSLTLHILKKQAGKKCDWTTHGCTRTCCERLEEGCLNIFPTGVWILQHILLCRFADIYPSCSSSVCVTATGFYCHYSMRLHFICKCLAFWSSHWFLSPTVFITLSHSHTHTLSLSLALLSCQPSHPQWTSISV